MLRFVNVFAMVFTVVTNVSFAHDVSKGDATLFMLVFCHAQALQNRICWCSPPRHAARKPPRRHLFL